MIRYVPLRALGIFALVMSTLLGAVQADQDAELVGPGGGGFEIDMLMSGNRLLTCVECGGVRSSDDGGLSWQEASKGLPVFNEIQRLWKDPYPGHPQTLFIGHMGFILKSTNNGAQWNKMQPQAQLTGHTFADFASKGDGQTYFAVEGDRREMFGGAAGVRTGSPGTTAQLWKSLDGGATWSVVSQVTDQVITPPDVLGDDLPSIYLHPVTKHLYVATSTGGVRTSTNDGAAGSWVDYNDGLSHLTCHRLVGDPVNSNMVYLTLGADGALPSRIFKRNTTSGTWINITANLPADPDLYDITVSASTGNIYVANFEAANGLGGVYRLRPGETQWTHMTPPSALTHGWIAEVATWGSLPKGNAITIDPAVANDQTMYFTSPLHDQTFKTSDGGALWVQMDSIHQPDGTWSNRGMTLVGAYAVAVDPQNPQRVFIGYGDYATFRSDNGGASWKRLVNSNDVNKILIDPAASQNIWMAEGSRSTASGFGVRYSSNGGNSWSMIGGTGSPAGGINGLPGGYVRDIALDPTTAPNARTVYVVVEGKGVYQRVGQAGNWIKIDGTGLPNTQSTDWPLRTIAVDPGNGGRPFAIYVGFETKGAGTGYVYKTTNGGTTWSEVAGARKSLFRGMAVNPNTGDLYFGATNGAYRLRFGTSTLETLANDSKIQALELVPGATRSEDVVFVSGQSTTVLAMWKDGTLTSLMNRLSDKVFARGQGLAYDPATDALYASIMCGGVYKIPNVIGVDVAPPTVPTGLQASAVSPTQVNLTWTPSTDNTAVVGYKVSRGGVQIATTPATSYADSTVAPGTAYSYSVAAYDAAGNTSAASSAVNVTTPALNAPPVLDPIGNSAVQENQPLAFSVHATDANGDPLTYNVTGLPAGASFSGGLFSWAPTYTQAGTYSLTFTVSDGLLTDAETLTVTVTNVNRPPVLGTLSNQTVTTGSPLTFLVPATDPDADVLTLWGRVDNDQTLATIGATLTEVTNQPGALTKELQWTPSATHIGSHTLTFYTRDGQMTTSQTVTVTVTAANQPPSFATVGPQTIAEGTLLTLTVSATDANGDPLTYSATNLPAGASFTPATRTFGWTPAYTQAGPYTVTFTVSDGQLTASQDITVTVTNVNQAPILTPMADVTVSEGDLVTLNPAASDPDADPVTITYSGWMTGPSYTTTYTDAGPHTVTVTVNDGLLSDTQNVTVTVTNVNRSPVLDPIANVTVNEGETITFSPTASDPDGDPVTVSYAGWMTSATYQTTYSDAGTNTVTVTASDGMLAASQDVTVTVTNVNRAPILGSLGNQTIIVGTLLSFLVPATDPDADALTMWGRVDNDQTLATIGATLTEMTNQPGALTKEFRWTPSAAHAGTHTLTFYTRDGQVTTSQTITVTVTPPANQPPVLAPVGPRTIAEGSPLLLTVSATDPNGDPLSYSASNLPSGATFSGQAFSWTPTYSQAGTYTVTFTVSDGALDDSETITITVTNVNRAPSINRTVLSLISGKLWIDLTQPMTISENQPMRFTVQASDPDGDPLTFSAENLPTLSCFNGQQTTPQAPTCALQEFAWTPSFSQGRTAPYQVTFKAQDNESTAVQPFTITVTNVPLTMSGPTASPNAFTPNGDGVIDTTTISATFNQPVTSWTLTLKNSAGTVIRTFTYSGAGTLTLAQVWNGNNGSGMRVPNGTFTCVLNVTAPDGGTATQSGTVTVR